MMSLCDNDFDWATTRVAPTDSVCSIYLWDGAFFCRGDLYGRPV